MERIRVTLIALGLVLGIGLNVVLAPQLMTPRPPVFNGPDVAENWEWRSMAIQTHSWWLSEKFPDAVVERVGFTAPPGRPNDLEVGMQFSQWFDPLLGLRVNTEFPPLDVVDLGIRDELRTYEKVYSRIHCRSGQEMVDRDTCYYFVAWDSELLPDSEPVFIGVRTVAEEGKEEMALVEKNLLNKISPVPLTDLYAIDEVGS